MPLSQDILDITMQVTRQWTKARKAEERGSRQRQYRNQIYRSRTAFTDVAGRLIPPAYETASGGGRYPVSKRQLFYACRTAFQREVGESLEYGYFSNTLLVQFLNRNGHLTSSWKVTADPRGTLHLPHVPQTIPVGTLAIDAYLDRYVTGAQRFVPDSLHHQLEFRWPGQAPQERFQALLYIEKEGFGPLLQAAQFAERFNIAILAGKGQSTVAARKLADHVCCPGGVPLLIVHDCDKAGFEIAQRLTGVSDWAEENDRVTYEFQHDIRWIDLGLRLEEARQFHLEEEPATFKGRFAPDSICTPEEQAFLRSHRRIELNAFSSPDFVTWLEQQFEGAGIQPGWIPSDDSLLEQAYRRAYAIAHLQAQLDQAVEAATQWAEELPIPDLRARLAEMEVSDATPWDQRLALLAQQQLDREDDVI